MNSAFKTQLIFSSLEPSLTTPASVLSSFSFYSPCYYRPFGTYFLCFPITVLGCKLLKKVGVGSCTSFDFLHTYLYNIRSHVLWGLLNTDWMRYIQLSFLFQGLYLLPVQKSASICRMTPSFKSMAVRKWAWPNACSQRRKWKHFTFHYKVGLDLIWCW